MVLILKDKSTSAWAERQIGENKVRTDIKTHLFMLLNVYVSRDQPVTMPPSGLIESAITRRRQKALEMTGFIDRFHLMHLTSRKPAGSEPRRGNVGISQRCLRCARKRFTDCLTTKPRSQRQKPFAHLRRRGCGERFACRVSDES